MSNRDVSNADPSNAEVGDAEVGDRGIGDRGVRDRGIRGGGVSDGGVNDGGVNDGGVGDGDGDGGVNDHAASDRPRAAVVAARRRARRSWRRYGAGMAVFLVAVAVFVFSVWRTSEIRNVHSHPTAITAKELPGGAIPSSLRQLWHTSDRMALGQPAYLDIVATYSTHTVSGHDATTGAVRWSYTRTDRSICSVVADGDVVVALYRHDGNCDELSALEADTGRRAWTRTQFENGTPSVQPIPQFILEVTPGALDLLRPAGDQLYWYYPQVNDCKTLSGVVGTSGVLWGARCGSKSTLTFRVGSGDKAKNNAWSVALDGRTPLAADNQILALSADHRTIQVLSAAKGRITSSIPVPFVVTAPSVPFATPGVSDSSVELITVPGEVIAVATSGASVLWHRATTGRVANTSVGLLFPSAGRVSVVSPRTGVSVRTITAPGLPVNSTVAVRGAGLVSSTDAGTTAWG